MTKYLGAVTANVPRSDVTPGAHGFTYDIPELLKDGNSHAIYGHALNTGTGGNSLLGNSPQFIKGEKTEVWMAFFGNNNTALGSIWDLVNNPEQAAYVLHNVDVIQLFLDDIDDVPRTTLRSFVALVKKYNIKVAVEVGGLYEWYVGHGAQAGEESA
ncbi:MAG TPA: hypothetical protein VEU33_21070 [Archangium sp.]|nr:hypothetical protein [Archangium sp.]